MRMYVHARACVCVCVCVCVCACVRVHIHICMLLSKSIHYTKFIHQPFTESLTQQFVLGDLHVFW